ncbi:MAG: MoaD/ThiS family protein [Deltaproteobacteria bacterium]|nr:MoaD/ThiS family protein [Deltaproteobacteria bacterium]
MKVKVHFHGILAGWTGVSSSIIDLPTNADYAALLLDIDRRFGSNMPGQLWNHEKKVFKGPILVSGNGRILKAPSDALIKGEKITFFLMVGGG